MVKDKTIVLRVDDDDKRRFEAAAQKKGQSMTTFIMDALEKATKKTEDQPEPELAEIGRLLAMFRRWYEEAARGGPFGYEELGNRFGECLTGLNDPHGRGSKDWDSQLGVLYFMASDAEVLAWLDRLFPKFMALVPRRRRAAFVHGIYRTINLFNEAFWLTEKQNLQGADSIEITFAPTAQWSDDRDSILLSATADGRAVLCVIPYEFLTSPEVLPPDADDARNRFRKQRSMIQRLLEERIERGHVDSRGEIILMPGVGTN